MPSMRNKLITYLRVADEDQIKALYTLLEKDIEENTLFINDEYRDLITDFNAFKEGRIGTLLERKWSEG